MAQDQGEVFESHKRSNWVRMRTLVILRWFAVFGQVGAILVAIYVFDLSLEIGLIAVIVALPVLLNLVSIFLYPESRRLAEGEAGLMIGFDLLQLGVLLYLTGGLNNPFTLLILAPVTVASTVLPLRSTMVLGAITLAIITLLRSQSLPIRTAAGSELMLPDLFVFGFWVALIIGVVFVAVYARQVTQETLSMGEALAATQMALAREQKLTDLGGVVAAAAHELGTPLATIKLVSSELVDELEGKVELQEDARLIREQADRCRDILQSMGRAGKEDHLLRHALWETVIREASEPHLDRGKVVRISINPPNHGDWRQPTVIRSPEIIHGVRNLVQNAVDFAESTVRVDVSWTDNLLTLQINDDGPGFPQSVLGRIGDPFVRRRRADGRGGQRPGYQGMGLGLFIAKTLLERSGGTLNFANAGPQSGSGRERGALINVQWPRSSIEASQGALGDNTPIT
ncbi:ActS/PrrB/RegB family redox-sensitive histidine kinase [Octadecabacter sp. 1_MG-2023]|uniref:sensor histidine kinase RegB n=1 Tax=unclassified Octadecabacter TaxID=196158 RepID=UPI001C07F2F7|nr:MULTISPECIES: ActS/PrrB/RegB family redox-sensitive histidine kinase [unclassified Octadecabacter]MBU2992333.1 ActS/PrrB/RegB family redox-sensitive histidine kinase [Octadecabacter sp. B2R22]MDO6734910.1 ActS/PrrB/RegB family redox-sensitive histidine kinase [Octadecabacter sp. 1_MG-2023]